MNAKMCISELLSHATKKRALINKYFFKTGEGEYAQHDTFIGLRVPTIRVICKSYLNLSYEELEHMLTHSAHEIRLAALIILTEQVKNKPVSEEHFLCIKKHLPYINNWDLVDQIAPRVIGKYVFEKQKTQILYEWARNKNIWIRRIAIVSTMYFIKQNNIKLTLNITKTLINDEHDLIHKATGWMLRESWKKEPEIVERFLCDNITTLQRTTLRYAIERMEEKKRKKILAI